jgi:hypothetical protein
MLKCENGIYWNILFTKSFIVSNVGKSQLMGRVGIGKTEDTTYILDVLGTSRMPGNVRIDGYIGISMDPDYRLDVFSNTST